MLRSASKYIQIQTEILSGKAILGGVEEVIMNSYNKKSLNMVMLKND